MSKEENTKENESMSRFELQMRKGVDYVFQKEGPLVDVLAEIASESETLIGKKETMYMLIDSWTKSGFTDSTAYQICRLCTEVERLCRSFKVLSEASLRWHTLLGRMYSELEKYEDLDE